MGFNIQMNKISGDYVEFNIRLINLVTKDRIVFLYELIVDEIIEPINIKANDLIRDEVEVLTVYFLKYVTMKGIKGNTLFNIKYNGKEFSITVKGDNQTFNLDRTDICDYIGSLKRFIKSYLDKEYKKIS